MSYKNNHYVPRLVLRRFADKVSVYNIKTGELAEDKRLEKVFALSELYSEEVEKEFLAGIGETVLFFPLKVRQGK